MKHIVRILTFMFVLSEIGASAVAQTANSNKAKAYYFQAEKAFNEQDFSSAFDKLSEAEALLGSPNPSTVAMKVKIYYGQNDLDAAKAAIEVFYGMDAGPNLAREMSDYLIKIDDDIQAEKDRIERARLAAIQAKQEAAIKELADAKAYIAKNKKGCENKIYADCYRYALQFYKGTQAAPQHYDTAAKNFGKSCQYRNEQQGRSCYSLGFMYEHMEYTPDRENDDLVFHMSGERLDASSYEAYLTDKAFFLYKNSCRAGYHYGCYNVGRMFETGFGDTGDLLLKPDSFYARSFYQKACTIGMADACKAVNEVQADTQETTFQTSKSLCDTANDLPACSIVARAYKDGVGTYREWTKAFVYYVKAAPHLKATCLGQPPKPDSAEACFLYAEFKNDVPNAQSYPIDYKDYTLPEEWHPIVAREYYEYACAKQHEEACEDIERLPRKITFIIHPIIEDCDKGDGDACLLLGLAYFNGQLADEATKSAKSTPYFQKGCSAIKKNEESCRLYQDAIAK